jgi:antagonist of KipI
MSQAASDAELLVVAPGQHTLVVDAGRPRCRSLGVPLGGAADWFSLALGNALVGNQPDAAALEIAFAGPTLQATAPLACVVYGAPFDLVTDRRALTTGTTFTLRPDERLHIGGARFGARAYLCVAGALDVPLLLGSRSGFAPLRGGERLPCHTGSIHNRSILLPREQASCYYRSCGRWAPVDILRLLPGPQSAWFPADALTATELWDLRMFEVTPESNRMGLRVRGTTIPVPPDEMLSEPVCPGTVQVTRDGQCVILGVDGQTIGGYPKIAQVIAADLDCVGQLRPGDRVAFEYTNLAEAELLYRQRRHVLREWVARLRTAEVFTS